MKPSEAQALYFGRASKLLGLDERQKFSLLTPYREIKVSARSSATTARLPPSSASAFSTTSLHPAVR